MRFEQSNTKGPRFQEYSEPEYGFLCRWDRPYGVALRNLIESWFVYYPKSNQRQFEGRFRSDRPGQHRGAFFELYLFNLFRACGLQVDVEPRVNWTTSTPDFLLTDAEGNRFIVEAINLVDTDNSPLEDSVLDQFNQQ